MAEVKARVIGKKNSKILVEIDSAQCGSCNAHAHCVLVEKNRKTQLELEYKDEDLKTNDEVLLMIDYSKVVFLSVLLYFTPVVFLFASALTVYLITNNEIYTAFAGLLGTLISFLLIYIFDRKKGKKYKHKIMRVLK